MFNGCCMLFACCWSPGVYSLLFGAYGLLCVVGGLLFCSLLGVPCVLVVVCGCLVYGVI